MEKGNLKYVFCDSDNDTKKMIKFSFTEARRKLFKIISRSLMRDVRNGKITIDTILTTTEIKEKFSKNQNRIISGSEISYLSDWLKLAFIQIGKGKYRLSPYYYISLMQNEYNPFKFLHFILYHSDLLYRNIFQYFKKNSWSKWKSKRKLVDNVHNRFPNKDRSYISSRIEVLFACELLNTNRFATDKEKRGIISFHKENSPKIYYAVSLYQKFFKKRTIKIYDVKEYLSELSGKEIHNINDIFYPFSHVIYDINDRAGMDYIMFYNLTLQEILNELIDTKKRY